MSRHRPYRAFTLLECVVVIVVLSIIALCVLPTSRSVDHTRAHRAALVLIADLDNARLQSMGCASDPCVVVFEQGGSAYFIARSSDPQVPIADSVSGRPWRRQFGLDGAATLTGVKATLTSGGSLVTFNGRGALADKVAVSYRLECRNATVQVTTHPDSGLSRIDD